MTLDFLNDVAIDAESTKSKKYVIIASLKSETTGKPTNASFDIKFTWLSFETTC